MPFTGKSSRAQGEDDKVAIKMVRPFECRQSKSLDVWYSDSHCTTCLDKANPIHDKANFLSICELY